MKIILSDHSVLTVLDNMLEDRGDGAIKLHKVFRIQGPLAEVYSDDEINHDGFIKGCLDMIIYTNNILAIT